MSGQPVPIHGPDHAADGPDPIPAAASVSMWPMHIPLIDPLSASTIGSEYLNGSWSVVWSTTAPAPPFGWYMTNEGNTANELFLYARLGPQGSLWQFMYTAKRGADQGKFDVAFQNVGETGNPSGLVAGTGVDGVIGAYSTFDVPPTLYNPVSGGGTNQWRDDRYHGSLTDYEFQGMVRFRLMGADGAPVTANVQEDADTNYSFDGGPGVYVFRIRTTGKNASSSAYTLRFGSFVIARLTDYGVPIG